MAPEVKSLVLELLETTEKQIKRDLFDSFIGGRDPGEVKAEMQAVKLVVEELRRQMT